MVLALTILGGCAALKDRLAPPMPLETGIQIQYEDPAAWRVEVAGQFNDWKTFPDPKALPLAKNEQGIWTIVIPYRENSKDNQAYIERGKRYQYKVVINGSSWVEDPNNPLKDTEGGITNSLLIVPEKR